MLWYHILRDEHESAYFVNKTDQYRLGDTVLVARKSSPTCPLAMMERYFSQARLSHSSLLLLFCGIMCTKNGEKLRSAGGLSYMHMCELFVAKLRELGFDTKQFGLHSLWSASTISEEYWLYSSNHYCAVMIRLGIIGYSKNKQLCRNNRQY